MIAPAVPTPTEPAPALLSRIATSQEPVTDHALLVLLGQFAQHLGLIALLHAVPLDQKTVDHTPQSKLIEFLVAILAGLDQLQELNDAPAPLVRDPVLHQAWGQAAFAHYSGVSRTLAAADATSYQAVAAALAQVSQPFIDREVLAMVRTNQPLTIDIDVTGRPVSPTSTDYPDAAFGWMDDAVTKGYQSAISSLSGGPSGRLLLAAQRYGGQVKSAECLQAAVRAVEAALQLHPHRRTELVQAQLSAIEAALAPTCQQLATAHEQHATAQWNREQLLLGQARRDARYQAKQARLEARLARTTARVERLERHVAGLRAERLHLTTWLATLSKENRALGTALRVVIRLDAGFATDANLAWLIEMGYTVLTKVHSGHTTKRIQRSLAPQTEWRRVGANAEACAVGEQRIGDGRYALQALQVRYRLGEGWRYTTLVYYDELPPPVPEQWFGLYNGRQTVEAGIKENKRVFTMRRPLVRSPIGMQIQEAFALFAANFVRWAAAWVQTQAHALTPALVQALTEVKTLVRVVAHSRAQVVVSKTGCALVFDAHSAFAGAVLLVRGFVAYQMALPLFTLGATTAQGVT